MAWLSLVAQILIVGTGGAVRLTGSGLGCPTWPRCTADSFVSTPEQGIHGVIEFGNRLLTFVLILIAIAMFLFVVRMRKQRPELFRLALVIGLGIPFQGVIGGITVLTNLDPYVVGLHFVLSTGLVVLATVLVYRVYRGRRGAAFVAPGWYVTTGYLASFFVGVTIIVGILTTGSGPHAGDKGSARNGLDSELLQHLHSYPAYITLALTIVLLVGALRMRLPAVVKAVGLLLAVEFAQIIVGISQSRMGLPELLVGIHMVLACVLAAAMTSVMLNLRSRAVPVSLPANEQPVGSAAV
ncbi:cytochrome oxidase assembly protein [Marisediminicola antarctica]|uniref:Cytochrome oxidase assembly protein n=2 Tax=Marisediminicola antarctica TaxID=674079 RepID=A0A7L5APC7_9MICO|nr:COX15/CtaA family protein [Marisediminicola antarctica]QHO71134.1 cytochrome oxidase assembly protein [Marisediminicola antarctica]